MGKTKFRKRPTIGFVLNNLQNRYGYQLWPGAAEAARRLDVNLLVIPGEAPGSPYGFEYQLHVLYDCIHPGTVDALVIASNTLCNYMTTEEFHEFFRRFDKIPTISIGMQIPGCPSVEVDNQSGMSEAVKHLIEVHGYRKIAFIRGPEANPEATARFQAYQKTMRDHELFIDPEWIVQGNFSPQSGKDAIRKLLQNDHYDFEAIVAANDDMAIGALEELESRGIRVPEDLAMVSFDNTPEVQFCVPALTTVRQPLDEVASCALELAVKRLAGEEIPEHTVMDTKLVVRTSCGCLPESIMLIEKEIRREEATTLPNFLETFYSGLDSKLSPAFAAEARAVWETLVNRYGFRPENNHFRREFLGGFSSVLREWAIQEKPISPWQNALTILETSFPDGPDVRRFVSEARVLVSEMTSTALSLLRIKNERRIDLLLGGVLQKLNSNLYIEDLMETIATELPRLNIRRCFLSLYTEEWVRPLGSKDLNLPHEAELILGYIGDNRIELSEEEAHYNPKKLLPRECLDSRERYDLLVKPLFFREEQFGLVFFDMAHQDSYYLETLRMQISSVLKATLLFRERKRAEEKLFEAMKSLETSNKKLENISQHDELTGLLNRRGFLTSAVQSLNLAYRMKKDGVVFFADLDDLKKVNDNFGHAEGDTAIQATAELLRKAFRDTDILGRIGGDEFIALAIDAPPEFASTLEKRLLDLIAKYNAKSGKKYKLSISLGAEPFRYKDKHTIDQLLSHADSLLYESKKKKKQCGDH